MQSGPQLPQILTIADILVAAQSCVQQFNAQLACLSTTPFNTTMTLSEPSSSPFSITEMAQFVRVARSHPDEPRVTYLGICLHSEPSGLLSLRLWRYYVGEIRLPKRFLQHTLPAPVLVTPMLDGSVVCHPSIMFQTIIPAVLQGLIDSFCYSGAYIPREADSTWLGAVGREWKNRSGRLYAVVEDLAPGCSISIRLEGGHVGQHTVCSVDCERWLQNDEDRCSACTSIMAQIRKARQTWLRHQNVPIVPFQTAVGKIGVSAWALSLKTKESVLTLVCTFMYICDTPLTLWYYSG